MDREKLKKYAEVVVKKGVAIKENQLLLVKADIEARDFVHEICRQALLAGAKDVGIYWQDKKIEMQKAAYGIFDTAGEETDWYNYYAKNGAAVLKIEAPDFEVFQSADTKFLEKMEIRERKFIERFYHYREQVQNCIAYVPTVSWALKTYPEYTAEDSVEKLWETIFFCMRLDEDDYLKKWEDFVYLIKKRREKLEKKRYTKFYFKSAETDLVLELTEDSGWYGGCTELEGDGNFYIPNLPTEEIFTVPSKYSAEGILTSTRPLNYNGKIIEKFSLKFEKGRVVDFSASNGKDILQSILTIDEGSCYLGEIAFVDEKSPIASLKKVFYTTLFDENASCHMALGNGLCRHKASRQERENAGINTSSIHIDFMIGSDSLNVFGKCPNGNWDNILVKGEWAAEFCF